MKFNHWKKINWKIKAYWVFRFQDQDQWWWSVLAPVAAGVWSEIFFYNYKRNWKKFKTLRTSIMNNFNRKPTFPWVACMLEHRRARREERVRKKFSFLLIIDKAKLVAKILYWFIIAVNKYFWPWFPTFFVDLSIFLQQFEFLLKFKSAKSNWNIYGRY